MFRSKNLAALAVAVTKNQVKACSSLPAQVVARQSLPAMSRSFGSSAWAGQSQSVEEAKESEKIKNLVNQILELDMLEVNQLLIAMQNKLGIPDEALISGGGVASSGGAAAASAAAAEPEPVKVKEDFDIKLSAVDAKAKIKIIKEVRTITGLGLKEAKELVEKAPVVIKEAVKKEEAEAFKKLLVEAGAVVDLV